MRLLSVVCITLFVGSCKCSSDEPIVVTRFGKIRGKHEDGFYTFHNIPYAEPPIGSRRFEIPIPYDNKWLGERDGTQAIIGCIRFGQYLLNPGSEDCLYLHIATPAINCAQHYPVRIDIHGGAYMAGGPESVDSSILVKHGMVVVTMGYRLGPLGFLSTGDREIPGNMGLKDQRIAFKWVKAHIEAFCGDANKILLAGTSAGGASAHIHLLQKSTENYINSVASHSGAATCPWAFETKPQAICKSFAKSLNCPMGSGALKTCLQSKTIEELIEATIAMQPYYGNPFTVFAPVVEPADSEDPVLTEHPDEIIRNGKAANITWLVAYSEREGSCDAATLLHLDVDGNADINMMNDRWQELAPYKLFYYNTKTVEEQNQYSAFLKHKYLGDEKFSEKNYRQLEDMFSDELFKNDIKKAVELHRKYCPGKVYVYYYKYPHNFTLGNAFSTRTDISFGADHAADTIFTIPMAPFLKPLFLTERDKKLKEKLLDMLLTWAHFGVLRFGGKELPLNSPTEEGTLTISENCFSIDGCTDQSDAGCNCYGYD